MNGSVITLGCDLDVIVQGKISYTAATAHHFTQPDGHMADSCSISMPSTNAKKNILKLTCVIDSFESIIVLKNSIPFISAYTNMTKINYCVISTIACNNCLLIYKYLSNDIMLIDIA